MNFPSALPQAYPDALAVRDALAVLAHPHPLRPSHRTILAVYALRGAARSYVHLRSRESAVPPDAPGVVVHVPGVAFHRAVQLLALEGWLVPPERAPGSGCYRVAPALLGHTPAEVAWQEALAACGLLPAPGSDPRTDGLPRSALSALERWEDMPHTQRNVLLLYALLGGFTAVVEERARVLAVSCGLTPPAFSHAVRTLAASGWLTAQEVAGRQCYRLAPQATGRTD